MPELLLEIFSEEIPARMQGQAARDLERMAKDGLAKAGLEAESLRTFVGPRRLVLVADGLPAATPDVAEERKGPRVGSPDQAIEGFLRSTGLSRGDLTERDGVYYGAIHRKGRPTPQIVAALVEEIVRGFPWPKSMRWGTGTLRWVRPIQRILCVFGGEVVPFVIDGVESGNVSEGHRFMGGGEPFSLTDFADYQQKLRASFVILDAEERKRLIVDGATAACVGAGLELIEDQGLLDEVCGLAEWPVPVLGRMDAAFLDLPPEVIRTSMRTHQKYFAVRDPATGGLAPRFLAVANIEASDGGQAIAAGNARVLSARLNDARFFWDEDQKAGFEPWLKKLNGVTFHAKLGTMAERVERIAALAREIAPLVGADPALTETAARLAKADLASGMVGEFPELQGMMGGYYARREPYAGARTTFAGIPADGEVRPDGSEDPLVEIDQMVDAARQDPEGAWYAGLSREQVDEVADAVRDHYRPQGPSDEVPVRPVTVAVALADKLDTLVGFFAIDEKPTGSRDPYALRRAALGVIRLVGHAGVRLSLREAIDNAAAKVWPSVLRQALRQTPPLVAVDLEDAHGAEGGFNLKFNATMDALDAFDAGEFELYVDCIIEYCGQDRSTYLIPAPESTPVHVFSEVPPKPQLFSPSIIISLLLAFFAERLKVLLRDQGKRHDLVDAVFALGDDDLVRIVARVEALKSFLATDDGANLLAGYKRATNILRAEEKKGPLPDGEADPSLLREPEEQALHTAILRLAPDIETQLKLEHFSAAMAALSSLRQPVDAFFDKVLVNAEDAAVRANRLRLLGQVRALMNQAADFSLISG